MDIPRSHFFGDIDQENRGINFFLFTKRIIMLVYLIFEHIVNKNLNPSFLPFRNTQIDIMSFLTYILNHER